MLKSFIDKYGSIKNTPIKEFLNIGNLYNEIGKLEKKYKTYDFYYDLVEKTIIKDLKQIPSKYSDLNMFKLGFFKYSCEICYIPRNFWDSEFWLFSYEFTPTIFDDIPDEFLTYDFYLECVKRDSSCFLRDLPVELKEDKLFLEAALNSKKGYEYLRYAPRNKITHKLCLKFCERFKGIPTEDILPNKYKSKKIIIKILLNTKRNYPTICISEKDFLKNKKITLNFCFKIIKQTNKNNIIFTLLKAKSKKNLSYFTF
jgi:hypothetical protein